MARTRKQVPLAVRVPPDQSDWLTRESLARNVERSAFVREVFEDARTCFGLPPADRELLEEEAARQRLELRRFVAEVLRETARELRAVRSVGPPGPAAESPVSACGGPGSNGGAP